MHKLKIACLLCLLVAMPASGLAQELFFDFSQNREIYQWGDSLVWQPSFGNRNQLLFTNSSATTLFKESILLDRRDRWQEDYRTRLEWRFNQDSRFRLSSVFENDYSSFEERIVVENSVGLAAWLQPSAGLTLENTGSFITAARNNSGNQHRANGFHNISSAHYNHRFSRSSAIDIGYTQDLKIIPEIPVSGFNSQASFFSHGLDDSVRLSLSGEYQNSRYFTSTRSYESISRQRKAATSTRLAVSLKPILGTRVKLLSNFDYRQFRYKHFGTDGTANSIGLLGSDNSSRSFDYKIAADRTLLKRVVFETHYQYRETDEDYSSLAANQKTKSGEVRFGFRVHPGINDSLWAEAIFSLTSYISDRESSFFSDRDRGMQLYSSGAMHRFSRAMSLRIDGSYRDFHQTFISGSLSANNNHDKTYVLTPVVDWQPAAWLTISNKFLLHANYVWYDHERTVSSERNTLFRRAQWKSEYELIVSHRLRIRPSFTYRYEDFGQLLWRDQWAQKTNWDRRTSLPALEVFYRMWYSIRLTPALTYERRKSWEFVLGDDGAIERVEKETFERTMVSFGLDYTPSANTSIGVKVQRRVQESNLFGDDKTNQFVVNVHRVF
ncbi:MAG: hypothetical protein KKG33_10325 [candidate division Zixibacteria bacterium]|nr:hypothetical protein [candidate division Zixibacteria bacterium]MBU1470182.1 hypothetical protein [candidate division Zixibacteria bacterium]MBU2625943.1 hypothetical protein [candidate division Zixibacteria bacterium]